VYGVASAIVQWAHYESRNHNWAACECVYLSLHILACSFKIRLLFSICARDPFIYIFISYPAKSEYLSMLVFLFSLVYYILYCVATISMAVWGYLIPLSLFLSPLFPLFFGEAI